MSSERAVFVRSLADPKISLEGGLDELKCEGKEDLNEENELCLKYTVQVANCSNAYFQMFYHPKWECTYMDLSPKVQIDWQLVKCDTVDKYPSPLPATYIAGTCYLRYGLKLNDDARNNKEPDKSPDELENPNLQTNESSLLWLYIAGGCLAGLFFLIGVLICFQAGINEQCSKTCCDCGELESLLCMQSCCEISVCCLHGFSRSD